MLEDLNRASGKCRVDLLFRESIAQKHAALSSSWWIPDSAKGEDRCNQNISSTVPSGIRGGKLWEEDLSCHTDGQNCLMN
jgi:hypothetical protein